MDLGSGDVVGGGALSQRTCSVLRGPHQPECQLPARERAIEGEGEKVI